VRDRERERESKIKRIRERRREGERERGRDRGSERKVIVNYLMLMFICCIISHDFRRCFIKKPSHDFRSLQNL